jgi:8-oxo-dGTP pyrophosphatase MutT (NUDIX family)
MNNVTAAGIYVFRNKNNNPEVLGLIAHKKERKRTNGKYDFPKGSIEKGEDALKAAFRECLEESGLTPRLIKKVPVTFGPLSLWVGIVDEDESVKIAQNPITGEYEHEGYEWITPQDAKKNCLNYLKQHAIECEKIVWEYFKI